jgi:hypothetical protein
VNSMVASSGVITAVAAVRMALSGTSLLGIRSARDYK